MTILANMSLAQQAEFQAAVVASGGDPTARSRAGRVTPSDFSGANVTAQIQAALDSAAPELFFPPGNYDIGAITLRPNKIISGTKASVLRPLTDGIKMLSVPDNGSTVNGIGVRDISIDMNAKVNVTGLDLPGVRHNCSLERIFIRDSTIPSVAAGAPAGIAAQGTIGIRLPILNWNMKLFGCEARALSTGFKLESTAACLVLDNFTAIACDKGFWLDGTNQTVDRMTEIMISGSAVCQQNNTGIYMRGTTRTVILSTHLENNQTDIDADGDDNLVIAYTAHRGNNTGLTGSTGIKLRNTRGTRIVLPAYAGVRQFGFHDIDTTNTDCSVQLDINVNTGTLLNSSFINNPGTNTGLSRVRQGQADVTGTEIAGLLGKAVYYKVLPTGSTTLSPTQFSNYEEFTVMIRAANVPTALTVAGYSVNLTNAAVGKVKMLTFMRNTLLGNLGYALKAETDWMTP